jgi:hypothetical protein
VMRNAMMTKRERMKSILTVATVMAMTLCTAAHAQNAQRIPTCGNGSPGPGTSPLFMDANGNLCQTGTTKPGALTAIASTQTLTLTTSAQTLTVPTGATSATLSVTGGLAIYRDDGTAPTATSGLTLPVGVWNYSGPLAAIQFILPTGVSGTVVTVAYYK